MAVLWQNKETGSLYFRVWRKGSCSTHVLNIQGEQQARRLKLRTGDKVPKTLLQQLETYTESRSHPSADHHIQSQQNNDGAAQGPETPDANTAIAAEDSPSNLQFAARQLELTFAKRTSLVENTINMSSHREGASVHPSEPNEQTIRSSRTKRRRRRSRVRSGGMMVTFLRLRMRLILALGLA